MDARKRDDATRLFSEVINKLSIENDSNTPDFILAEYLVNCLDVFTESTKRREKWYGVIFEPGKNNIADANKTAEIHSKFKKPENPWQNLTEENLPALNNVPMRLRGNTGMPWPGVYYAWQTPETDLLFVPALGGEVLKRTHVFQFQYL